MARTDASIAERTKGLMVGDSGFGGSLSYVPEELCDPEVEHLHGATIGEHQV